MRTNVVIILSILFVLLLVVFAIFAAKRRAERLSGKYGERKVSNFIDELKRDGELLINDYLASRNSQGTHSIQIDHIFISHKGIFVIETKDYRGRIYGDRYQKNWTQVLAYGGVKNRLYNPIMQNETHVHYVKNIIGDRFPIHNVVIFLEADTSRVRGASDVLFSRNSFARWYRNLQDNRLSNQAIERVNSALVSEMKRHQISKEEHIQNVRRKHGEY